MQQRGKEVKDWQLDRRIGNAVFKVDFIKNKGRDRIDRRQMEVLRCDEWVIIKYSEQDWKYIFSEIQVCHIQKLWIGFNSIPNIIHHISGIAFMGLIQLHLFQNQITSLEPLSRMRFPHLFILDISWNYISTLNYFKFISMPKLASLTISGNPIKRLNVLSQCSLKNLDILELQWPSSPPLDESIQWLARMNSKKIRMARCESQERIVQNESVGKMLRRRYQGLRIKYLQKTGR